VQVRGDLCLDVGLKPPREAADSQGVEPDLLSKELSACPRCGAGVRADAPWCTQCFLNLRTPAPEPVTALEPTPVAPVGPVVPAQPLAPVPPPAGPSAYAAVDGLDPLTAPLHALLGEPAPPAARSWPCTACGTANGFDLDACASCGQGFLAGLSDPGSSLVLPGVGDLAAMSKGKRLGLAFAVALAFMALVAMIGLLLG
jgi:hypothetical protein